MLASSPSGVDVPLGGRRGRGGADRDPPVQSSKDDDVAGTSSISPARARGLLMRDLGRRCSTHVGEAFMVRCAECAELQEDGDGVTSTDGIIAEPWAPSSPDVGTVLSHGTPPSPEELW